MTPLSNVGFYCIVFLIGFGAIVAKVVANKEEHVVARLAIFAIYLFFLILLGSEMIENYLDCGAL